MYISLTGPGIVPGALSDLERKQIATVHIEMDSNTATIVNSDGTGEETVQAKIVCDNQKTTCFVEAETMVTSRFRSEKMFTDVTDTLEDIRDFLGKPYLYDQVAWDANIATNASILTVPATPTDGIGSLLTTVTQWEVKRRGFELVRGTFVLRLEINSNPFQAGSAIVHYLPNYADRVALEVGFAKRYNKHLIQKFQHPYVRFEVKDTCVIFKVPYIAPTPWYDIKNSDWDWGSIFVDVISVFATGGAGNTYAEVSAFIYWEDIQLAAPIVPQMDNKSGVRRRVDREKIEYNPGKPISSTLALVGDVADSVSSIPILSKLAGEVSWAASVAGGLASSFGWSKPRTNGAPNIIADQEFRYLANADGPDMSHQTAMISDNGLSVTTSYSLTDEDEMSLKYLLSIPTYMGVVNWTAATASSDNAIYSLAVKPRDLYLTDDDVLGIYTASYKVGAPLYYFSNFFKLWRGSFKLTINIVKTIYHSGKLLITWSPFYNNLSVAVTRANSIYSLRHIMDIREQSTFTLDLPYLVNRPYLDNEVGEPSGTLNIFILNELRAPETAAQAVDLEIYYTAGDNFEYQIPAGTTDISNYGVYTPQMDNGSELIVSMGIADTPVKDLNVAFSSMSIGEHFVSLKQLLNRYSALNWTAANALASKYFNFYPWYVTGSTLTAVTGVLTTGDTTADAFSFITPLYAYIRGSVRSAISSTATNGPIYGQNLPNAYRDVTTPTTFWSVAPLSYGAGGNLSYGAIGTANFIAPYSLPFISAVPHGSQSVVLDSIQVPYQSKFPVTIPYIWNTTSQSVFTNANDWLPTSIANYYVAAANFGTTTTFQRAAADDFQCSFFIGCPPLLTDYIET